MTSNKIFLYIVWFALGATVLIFSDAITSYIVSVFISEPAPQTEDIGTDCGLVMFTPFTYFVGGAIVLFPVAAAVGFTVVWFNNRRLNLKALPHQMPSTIWRKY